MNGLPTGAWVAISVDKVCILAFGEDPDLVEQEALTKDSHPLITRVPDPNVMWAF